MEGPHDTGAAAAPDPVHLAELAGSDSIGDRAFAVGALRLAWAAAGPAARRDLERALAACRAAATARHAPTRRAIATGALRGAALRACLAEVPSELRDHWIEEVLDLAHPPLDAASPGRHGVGYVPSGVDEILHAIDTTGLGPGATLTDLGAGMGKVVLLASLLTGARACGVELDGALVAAGRDAATALGCVDHPARPGVTFVHGDARDADLGAADVYFLYVPFTGPVLRRVMDRLAEATRGRRAHVCASAIDTDRHPWLTPAAPPRSWLEVYATR